MPQLDPTWFASQIFWLVITFAMLYLALSRTILPALQGGLEHRAQTIASDLALADSLRKQAEHAQHDYEQTLADARIRVQHLMDEAAEISKQRAEKAGKELDAQIARKLEAAEQQLARKKEHLMQGLAPLAAELTGLTVEKLARQTLSRDQLQRIVSEVSE